MSWSTGCPIQNLDGFARSPRFPALEIGLAPFGPLFYHRRRSSAENLRRRISVAFVARNRNMQALLVSQIAALVGGAVQGEGDVMVTGTGTLDTVQSGQLTFADGSAAVGKLCGSPASAAIVPTGHTGFAFPTIAVSDVHASFARVVAVFHPPVRRAEGGIHASSYVSPQAQIGRDTHVLPGAYIAEGAVIGSGCWIGPQVTILEDCRIGDGVTIFPHAVLYERTIVGDRCIIHAQAVLGAYGFGYRTIQGRHELSAQLGWVELGSDVEIGACTTIDRGTYGPTQVGEGTKIDNHVMIAHNCRIGRHNLLCSQVGIAGSSSTGDYVVMAGQVGVPDHVSIGHRAVLGAQAGILRDVPDGQQVLGSPATPERQQMQIQATLMRLPEMRRELRELRRLVQQLTTANGAHGPAATQKDAA